MKVVYRESDGVFLFGGPYDAEPRDVTEGVCGLDRYPDPRLQRWDAQAQAVRDATPEEIVAYDDGQTAARADTLVVDAAIVATLASVIELKAGQPATQAQVQAAIARWRGYYRQAKSLLT